MAHTLSSLPRAKIFLLLTLSLSALALALPTTDSSTVALESTNTNTLEISPSSSSSSSGLTSASVQESSNYVCQEGCRKPCFNYNYCSSCNYLKGYE
ncbi:uncharacterized protein RCO7_14375 [Rhynchosporium graminicola]|uniref:Uncharacterized protein n=2 Tax=Rhynchosporium TaxID=38037 RepID=A0A1E1MCR1_RHYSE|nr:uncharacterized protein RCO7_14375 [Rhynchosporium commune]CZT46867.1 uncharacterized protein RSE6_07369 [Rhynchosporium secalis]